MNHKKLFKFILILAIAFLLIAYFSLSGKISNTLKAYDMVSANYETFNYPNTIKVHSGTLQDFGENVFFLAEISSENAYGQTIYHNFLCTDDGIFSFDWYEENGMPISDSMVDLAKGSNIVEPLLNFLIKKDW